MTSPTRAVVFAYHNVGVRCLKVLHAAGVDIALVVSHPDNPEENCWFDSVAEFAREHDIPFILPLNVNRPEIVQQIAALQPDFMFSFYYRQMLSRDILQCASRGAYNMHGSLLPKYRGRVPVNWAVLQGETETGATLHRMTEKPDAGEIVGQMAVPILPDDNAKAVFDKVVVAGEWVLHQHLPALLAGQALHRPQDLSAGSYFSGRTAEDGRIHWSKSARQIHNLVRAVSHPYPGAFIDIPEGRLFIWRTRVRADLSPAPPAQLWCQEGRAYLSGADGVVLQILEATLHGQPLVHTSLSQRAQPFFSGGPHP
jgi:methionyl-tRNA formyltransferase